MAEKKVVGKPAVKNPPKEESNVDAKLNEIVESISKLQTYTKSSIEEINSKMLAQQEPTLIENIGQTMPIEKITYNDFCKDVEELEVFMADVLTIRVALPINDEIPEIITPSVNGQKAIIKRGVPTKVRRYIVEALMRSRQTTYKSVNMDPRDLSKIGMAPTTVWSYEFTVEHDPSPKGKQWLEALRQEAY